MQRQIFISDVHLQSAHDHKFDRFSHLINGLDPTTTELYLLGDIFDFWIGAGHLYLEEYQGILDFFRETTRRGLRVSFVPGNRDYLVCQQFEAQTGIRVLGERVTLLIDGRRIVLTHGDFLYNHNYRYTVYRSIMASPLIRFLFTSLPASCARRLALGYKRLLSGGRRPEDAHTRNAGIARYWRERPESYYIDPALPLFEKGAEVVVCGHIHVPGHYQVPACDRINDLVILGDWDHDAVYAECLNGTFTLRTIPA